MTVLLEAGVILRERYQIIELVGQGGMGAVYKAFDLRLDGRICAIKEVLPELLGTGLGDQLLDQTVEQFYREASVLARLDQVNLPKVSDYFSVQRREYLVMDYVDGRDLEEILKAARSNGHALSEADVLGWAAQLLDALHYLHGQDPPVLHRDIKPANIKLTDRGAIKLVDFGLVKLMQAEDSRTVTVVQGQGTVAYTPLEQYGGDTGHTDVRTDIYSAGATFYHLLAGEPPANARERFLQPGCLKPLRQLNPDISARTERAIFQAMSMHPNERPACAADFRTLLLGSTPLAGTHGSISLLPEPDWGETLRRYRHLVGVALFLALVAIILSALAPGFQVP